MNVLELEDRFSTEEACRQYLAQLRWPDGFLCPQCKGTESWLASRGRMVCRCCRHQTSAMVGTIFQGSHKPLRLWFRAIWYVISQKNGVSAIGLQRALGLGSYQTAWTWLHKLRRAMVRPGRDRLHGRVEVDETMIGGLESYVDGKQLERKETVAIAAEEDGRGIGRIRMACVSGRTKAALRGFVKEVIEPGSVVHTDGAPGYDDIEKDGYGHEVTVLSDEKEKDAAVRLLPRVHRVASLVKRWLLGTHQGAVQAEHLDYYLDEFTFRFNRRKSKSRGKLFYRLIQQAVQVEPAPYKTMIGGKDGPEMDHQI